MSVTHPHFSATRFMRLWRAHWAESLHAYIWFFGVCIIVYCIMAIFALSTIGYRAFEHNAQQTYFFAGLLATGAIFAVRYFEGLARKESALVVLMRPASTFEKWLLAFVIVALIYPVVYTLIYCTVNLPAVFLSNQMVWTELKERPTLTHLSLDDYNAFIPFVSVQHNNGLSVHNMRVVQWLLFVFFVIAQGFCVAASLYFNRLPILKTVLAGFILLIAYFIFLAISGSNPSFLITYWFDKGDEVDNPVLLAVLAWLVWLASPVLLWASAYFHLKEREVV